MWAIIAYISCITGRFSAHGTFSLLSHHFAVKHFYNIRRKETTKVPDAHIKEFTQVNSVRV